MTEIKRGAVLILQAGDADICEALAEGAMAGRAARLNEAQRRTVEAEIDRQAIQGDVNPSSVERALLRVAVGNTKTAEDYAQMRFKAELDYGESVYDPTLLRRAVDKALAIYAMFVEAVAGAYRAQGKVLEER